MAHYDANPDRYYSSLNRIPLWELLTVLDVPAPTPWLDLGCGDGRLADFGPTTGVDYSQARIDVATERYPTSHFHCADVYDWVQHTTDTFETVFLLEVLEHLEEPVHLLTLIRHHINPHIIVATVPNQMVYEAHLQVYNEHTVHQLNPTHMVLHKDHWLLAWH
jgi:2-polyprenyl-3-methyl-5-hydroxy-6-metoxy-1,4-benzoquinol methylase